MTPPCFPAKQSGVLLRDTAPSGEPVAQRAMGDKSTVRRNER